MKGRVLAAAIVLLYVLHQDFWYWRDARPLVFGFLPIGLFYHAVFTLVLSLTMWVLVRYAWPSQFSDELGEEGSWAERPTTAGSVSKAAVNPSAEVRPSDDQQGDSER
ncbi:MAG TPA: DUF3311 domain-containing protein [Blastocatellia bacterium]|nr:DUF3311 domain-containing protein [Blastocatellia bacterium]